MDKPTKLRSRSSRSRIVTMVPVLRRMSPRTLKRTHSFDRSQTAHKQRTARKLAFTDDPSQMPHESYREGSGVKKIRTRVPKVTAANMSKDCAPCGPTAFEVSPSDSGREIPPECPPPPLGGVVKRKRGRPPGRKKKHPLEGNIEPSVTTTAMLPTALVACASVDDVDCFSTVGQTRNKVSTTDGKPDPIQVLPCANESFQSQNTVTTSQQAPQANSHCQMESSKEKTAKTPLDVTIQTKTDSDPSDSDPQFAYEGTDSLGSHIDYPPPSTSQQREARRLARLRQLEEMKKRESVFARNERIRKRTGLQVVDALDVKKKKVFWRNDLVQIFLYSPVKDSESFAPD